MRDIFWVAKISNTFGGVLEIPGVFFRVTSRCWARAYVWRKNESTPWGSAVGLSSALDSDGKQNTAEAGARGTRNVAFSISSHEQTQLNRVCCFLIL